MMSATFLITTQQAQINLITGRPYVDLIEPLLRELLSRAGTPARRVQELHWFSADEDYWYTALAQRLDLPADLPHFHWPAMPLLAHASLQSISRAVEIGECDLLLLGQQSGDQVIALLLSSPDAVRQHSLSTRAQLSTRFSVSRRPDGFLASAARAITAQGRDPQEISLIASSIPMTANELKMTFPKAKALPENLRVVSSDLFLLDGLVSGLEAAGGAHGLLLSAGPHGTGLATWVERK